jgi:hypothetical protein
VSASRDQYQFLKLRLSERDTVLQNATASFTVDDPSIEIYRRTDGNHDL